MHQIGGAENSPEEDANARALASPNHCKMATTILPELEWCKRSLKCIRTKYNIRCNIMIIFSNEKKVCLFADHSL